MRHFLPALLSLPLILTACSQPARQEITDVREPGATKREAPPRLDARQRLGMRTVAANTQQGGGADGPLGGITFHHDMPEGWEAVPKTSLRQVNLRMIDVPEAECYFTFLPGGGGGLEANLNRWRRQMGLEALSEEAIAALPTKPIFGRPATFIQIDGDFTGMGDDPKPDYRMYGLVLNYTDPQSQQDQAFFLKMVGPKAVLAEQEDAFDLVASSIHAVAPGDEHTHDHDEGGDHAGHDHGEDEDHTGHDHAPGEGHGDGDAMETAESTDSGGGASGYEWNVPEGWESLEPTSFRVANLTVSGHEDVECYLTVLGGTGGGLEMNINRWRQQMGQPDLSSDDIASLPKHTLLGEPATFVTIDGVFGGMRGETNKENFRMYGLARVDDTQAYFVKMTGPQAVLEAEKDKFLAFSASIREGGTAPSAAPQPVAEAADATTPPNPHGMEDPTPEGGFNPEGLTWEAPEGWQDGGERMMRVVTYEIGDVECYITSLAGPAGGVNANINRWVGQMGQPALDETALEALPRIPILESTAPMVEVSGDFTGMSGEERESYKLLGTVVPMGDQTVFVKMTGPEAEVNAQKDNFIDFCASIKP